MPCSVYQTEVPTNLLPLRVQRIMDIDEGIELNGLKRKGDDSHDDGAKKQKASGPSLLLIARAHRYQHNHFARAPKGRSVAPPYKAGDAGIWITCPKGKERKCIGEMMDVFDEVQCILSRLAAQRLIEQYVTKLHGDANSNDPATAMDIEQDITTEIEGIRRPQKPSLIEAKWTDIPCRKLCLKPHLTPLTI